MISTTINLYKCLKIMNKTMCTQNIKNKINVIIHSKMNKINNAFDSC